MPKKRVVRIPFVSSRRPLGLGTAIEKATAAVGIKPCEKCKKRAKWLNDRVEFASQADAE